MIIYGEFLFIENFITTFLLLSLTAKLTGYHTHFGRKLSGSLIGAVSSFIIFWPMSPFTSIILRVLSGTICVLSVFGHTNLVAVTAIFFILTFTSGGMVMAILLWLQESAINHQGIIYIDSVTYFKLLSIGILAFGFTYWFIKLIRCRKIGSEVTGMAELIIKGERYFFRSYVDSGNSLKEPISGKSVILIDKAGAKKLTFEPSSLEDRFALIPYRAVGVEMGVLEGIRLDRAVYGEKSLDGVFLAFYQGDFDGYELLLNNEFLEGGLLDNINKTTKETL